MKRIFLIIAMLCMVMSAFAAVGDTFTVNGITYTVLTLKNDPMIGKTGTVEVAPSETTYEGKVIIPNAVNQGAAYKVVGIGDAAFKNSNISAIEIPSNVTYIGTEAFMEATKLDSITIPENITSVGTDAFKNAGNVSGYSTITIDCKSITYNSFSFMKFSHVIFGEHVVYYFNNGFHDNDMLYMTINSRGIFLYSNFVQDNNLFTASAGRLRQVTVNVDEITISPYAFYHDIYKDTNPSLEKLIITGKNVSIGESAFENQVNLYRVTFGESLAMINKNAFANCRKLTSLLFTAPYGLIRAYAFAGADITQMIFMSGYDYEPNAFATIDRNAVCISFDYGMYTTLKGLGFKKVYYAGTNTHKEYVDEDVNKDGDVNSLDVLKVYKFMQTH